MIKKYHLFILILFLYYQESFSSSGYDCDISTRSSWSESAKSEEGEESGEDEDDIPSEGDVHILRNFFDRPFSPTLFFVPGKVFDQESWFLEDQEFEKGSFWSYPEKYLYTFSKTFHENYPFFVIEDKIYQPHFIHAFSDLKRTSLYNIVSKTGQRKDDPWKFQCETMTYKGDPLFTSYRLIDRGQNMMIMLRARTIPPVTRAERAPLEDDLKN